MKNKEKYAKEIMNIACSGNRIAMLKKSGRIVSCEGTLCSLCSFYSIDCRKNIKDWTESECVKKPVISKRDRAFLEYIDKKFNYIARTYNGHIRLFAVEPERGQMIWKSEYLTSILDSLNIVLPMVKWEDEPWLIGDLKKLEVVEEYE